MPTTVVFITYPETYDNQAAADKSGNGSAVATYIEQARQDSGADKKEGGAKRPADDESDEEPADEVRLHEDGWRDR